jgi:hypothetical protein
MKTMRFTSALLKSYTGSQSRAIGFNLDQEAVMQLTAGNNCARRAIVPKNPE